ncbi:AAA family ATPase, partial [Algiphilus sp. W345]
QDLTPALTPAFDLTPAFLEEGGYLTEAVRRRPYAVILLDEVFNILLQVLDDGRLTDGQGRTVDFRNAVIVMTSNLGSNLIQEMGSFGYEDMKSAVMEVVRGHFRPEFINRIDEAVVFHSLGSAQIRSIAAIQTEGLKKRLSERGIGLVFNDGALDRIAEAGFDPVYGARPLKRAVQTLVENPLTRAILDGQFVSGDTVRVSLKDGAVAFDRA